MVDKSKKVALKSLVMGLVLWGSLAACAGVRLPGAAPADPLRMTPEEVVEAFYNWALEYPGNAVVEGAFRDSPFLSHSFIQSLDECLNDPQNFFPADPLFLAQSFPKGFRVRGISLAENRAQVVLHQDFGGGAFLDLTIDLVLEDGEWKIDRIQNGNPLTPGGVTKLFYNAYIRSIQAGQSPLIDGTYRSSPYLSAEFIEQIDAQRTSSRSLELDLFSMAAPGLAGVDVYEPVIEGDSATVLVEFFWLVPEGPAREQLRKIHLSKRDGLWQIEEISTQTYADISPEPALQLPLEAWQSYRNERFRFEMRYPPGWVLREEQGGPAINLLLMPADVAQEYRARVERGVLPDRTRPLLVPPFNLTVFQGSRESFDEYFPAKEPDVPVVFDRNPGGIRHLLNGAPLYFLQHSHNSQVWLVVFDQVSTAPRYAAQAKAVEGVLELILQSLNFYSVKR